MLDIAVAQPTGFPTAGAIEDCLCPRGYSGRSCERCAVGHFRDESDRDAIQYKFRMLAANQRQVLGQFQT